MMQRLFAGFSITGRMSLLIALLFTLPAWVNAAELAPDVLVKNVTGEVLDIVRQDKDIRSGNTQKALELVEAKVLPHFDFKRMAQLAMGREGRKATPVQMDAVTEAFKTLLVRTYSKALTEFRDQEIVFKPFKADPAATDVKVRSEIHQSGGKPVPLDYFLAKSATAWQVYDMEVGGVSLVTNYRTSFAQEIQAKGVDGLIQTLQAKNQKAAASATPSASAAKK